MVKIEEVLAQALKLFKKNKIKYMLVGGLAVGYWGEPRFTKDIDLSVYLDPANIDDFMTTLAKNKFVFHKEEIKSLIKLCDRFAVMDPSDTYRIDLWVPRTELAKKALDRRLKKKIGAQQVCLITPEDLILFKLLAGRPQDTLDIKGILARQKGKLDRKYLKSWAMGLNKYQELKKIETSLTS